MPAFDLKETTPTLPELPIATKPVLTPEVYKNSLVDDKREHYAPQMLYMEGSTLVVTWLSQVLAADEEPRVFSPTQLGVYQKYTRIKNYELKLSAGLSASFASTTSEMTYSGTAHCLPGVTPNYGDVFIAYIGEKQVGLFAVIEPPTQKSPFRDTVYEINFQMIDYMTDELLDIINRRVVLEKTYAKNYLLYGRDPVVSSEDISREKDINEAIGFYISNWANEFFSHEMSTFVVPDQAGPAYDPQLMIGLRMGLEFNEHPIFMQAKFYNLDEFGLKDKPSLWTALIAVEPKLLPLCDSQFCLIFKNYFVNFPLMSSFRYTRFYYAVMPTRNPNTADAQYGFSLTYNASSELTTKTPPFESDEGRTIPPIGTTYDYCFSPAFYQLNETANMSSLEYLLMGYLKTKTCDYQTVIAFLSDSAKWNKLQRFYLIPALVFVLKGLARRTS